MANAGAPLEFTEGERATVSRLALVMKWVAAVLFLLAAINVGGGIMTLLGGAAAGIMAVIEGLVAGLLGLIMLASSTNVRFMVETKFSVIQVGKAFQNLTVFYKVQLFLAIPIVAIRLLLG